MDSNSQDKMIKSKEVNVGLRFSNFEIIKELGKGSYGTVYTVRSKLDSNVYVLKKMDLNHLKESQQKECYREISILRKVNHQNIIKYYSSFLENESLCLIMEYAELGDLYSLIKHYKRHKKFFDELILWRIAYEVLTGLEYLHSNNIIHRDIKCLNLFLSKDHHIKIGDLGVSTISALGGMHCTRVGTPLYLSPELVKQIPYDYKTDIWSFGCSMYHLASLEPPFSGTNLIALGNNIVKEKPRDIPSIYSNELKQFIDKLLSKKPEKRPSAKEALNMIPKDILEKVTAANDNYNKIVIKSRPFSSKVIKKTIESTEKKIPEEKIIDNNNKEKNEVKKVEPEKKIENEKKKDEKKDEKNEPKKADEEPKKEADDLNKIKIEKTTKEIRFTRNTNNIIDNMLQDNTKNVLDDNIVKKERQTVIYSQKNNVIEKSNTLVNGLYLKRNFDSFRKNSVKKSKEEKTQNYNLISQYNNVHQNKSNSIKVYSPSIRKELIEIKQLDNKINDNKISKDLSKNTKRKPSTDTNIQLISINNNNFFISNINSYNHKQKRNMKSNIIRDAFKIKNVEDKKKVKDNYNILFPNLKYNKSTLNQDKELNKKIFLDNNPKIIMSNRDKRPYSSVPRRANGKEKQMVSVLKHNLRSEKNEKIQKKIKRPMTGMNSKSNVMNININFYNIDMNKRFLAPNINPLNVNDINNDNEDYNKNNKIINSSNVNLDDYKNSNEFIFQKLIRAFQDINSKKLTINDLK